MTLSTVQRRLDLPARADSPRLARRAVAEVLRECGRSEWADDAELAVSELVTNAVLHAGTPVVLTIECDVQHLRVDVRDADTTAPHVEPLRYDALGGRGLGIVGAVTHDFGVEHHPGGKTVWFTITASSPAPPAGIPGQDGGACHCSHAHAT